MIRVLTPAPEQYNAPKLTAEMQAAFPSCVAVNEVEAEKKYVAVYFKDNVPAEVEIAAIVAAHDPTPVVQPPTNTERIAALEAALLELMLREV